MIRSLRLLAALPTFLTVTACAPNLSDVITEFHTALAESRTTDAATLLTGGAVALLPEQELLAWLYESSREYAQHGGIKSIEIRSQAANVDRGTVEYTIHFNNSTAISQAKSLIHMPDGWMIVAD